MVTINPLLPRYDTPETFEILPTCGKLLPTYLRSLKYTPTVEAPNKKYTHLLTYCIAPGKIHSKTFASYRNCFDMR